MQGLIDEKIKQDNKKGKKVIPNFNKNKFNILFKKINFQQFQFTDNQPVVFRVISIKDKKP